MPTRNVVLRSALCVIRGDAYAVAGGMEVTGQEKLPWQKSCKTLICVPEESSQSASQEEFRRRVRLGTRPRWFGLMPSTPFESKSSGKVQNRISITQGLSLPLTSLSTREVKV